MRNNKESKKQNGQYMTPSNIVKLILDEVGYFGESILNKKIIEPSFGDGAFLEEIVRRIIETASKKEVKRILEENVFGIEKDSNLYHKAIQRLDNIIEEAHIEKVNWKHIINGDTLLLYEDYIGKFDFVVGNPPYVNIHNIKEEYRDIAKQFQFTKGTVDLYVIFYELGIMFLNENGKLGFISPNTFMINKSQRDFRNLLIDKKLITRLFNFKYHQVFEDASTYTCICILDKNNKNASINYKEYREDGFKIDEVFEYSEFHHESWILGSKEDLTFLNTNMNKENKLKSIAMIQNGIATNRDDIYIHNIFEDEILMKPYKGKHTDVKKIVFFFDKDTVYPIETTILHRVVKATKFNGTFTNEYIIYPYKEGNIIPEEKLMKEYPLAYRYLFQNKEELLKRDMEKNTNWYAFGRSQGIVNMEREKIVIKRFMDKRNKIIPYLLEQDVIVYACICFTSDEIYKVMDILTSDKFYKYCCLNGRDMQKGFIGLSSSVIKNFGI